MVSCNKDNAITNPQEDAVLSARDAYVWSKITSFSNKFNDSNSRDNVLVPSDSVVWYIETMLNIEMSVDTTFDKMQRGEFNYSLNVDESGYVLMSEISYVYDLLVADINNQIDQIDADYKYLIIADLFEQPSRDGSFGLAVYSYVGTHNRGTCYTAFTQDDNWYYGNNLGREDGYLLYHSDAGQQLAYRINNQKVVPEYEHVWVDVHTSPNAIGSPTNSRLFYQVSTTPPVIPYTDMTTFLWSIHYYAYNELEDTPYGFFPAGTEYANHWFRFINLWTNEPNPSDNILLSCYKLCLC